MKTPLSQTSAFVLACDKGQSYQSAKAKKFLSHLDLSEGEKMRGKVLQLQPKLDQSIHNRKFLIHNFIRKTLKAKPSNQVLALACGWDPILVKMSEEFPKNFFFGLDNASVNLQKRLIQKIKSPISYIQTDIRDSHKLIEGLSSQGWQKNKPSSIILEGITYYIPPDALWKALKNLKQNIYSDCFICGDFLVDWKRQRISQTAENFALSLFNMIKKNCSQDYFSYTSKEIQKNLEALGFSEIQFFKQDEIQKQRTGGPTPWGTRDSHIQLFTAQNL